MDSQDCILPAVRFSEGNASILYAGDFDPEGLGIAQRLKDRYGSRLELWEYKPEYYLRARSAENLPEETISPERMKKLDKLKDAELVKIADLIRQYGKAVYQETMLEWAYRNESELQEG